MSDQRLQQSQPEEISRFITIIRPEFMTFCRDACRSAALNHLLFRIAYKAKDQPKEKIQAGQILWYAKTGLIVGEMSRAWGDCKVRKEVNGLVDMGLIGRCSNPAWGADRTKHFTFGSEQCSVLVDLCEKNGICLVHLGLPAEVMHLIYSANANDKSIKCSCPDGEANDKSIKCKSSNHQMQTMNPSDAFDKNIEAIPEEYLQKNYNKDNTEERGSESAKSPTTNDPGSAIASPTPSLALAFAEFVSNPQGELNGNHHLNLPGNTPGLHDQSSTGETSRTQENQETTPEQAVTQQSSYSPEKSTATTLSGASEVSQSTIPPANTVSAPQPAAVTGGRGYTKRNSNAQKVSVSGTSTKPVKPTRARARSSEPTEYKVYFTVEGALFKGWYEAASGIQLDETYPIARACNSLGARASVTEEHVKMVVDQMNADELINKKGIGVTVQDLAGDGKWLCWDKWLQGALVAQRNKNAAAQRNQPQAPGASRFDLEAAREKTKLVVAKLKAEQAAREAVAV